MHAFIPPYWPFPSLFTTNTLPSPISATYHLSSPLLSSSPVTTPGDYDVSAEVVRDAYMQKTASDLNDSQVSDIVL